MNARELKGITEPKRRSLQFSVRGMLGAVTVLALLLAWHLDRAHRVRRALAAIREIGGEVAFDYQIDPRGAYQPYAEPPAPKWLRRLAGDEYFGRAHIVFLARTEATDAHLDRLKCMTDLRELYIGQTRVTEAGISEFREALPNVLVHR